MLKCVLIAVTSVVFALLGVAVGTAEAASLPLGFEVPATNGYRATVLAGSNPKVGRGGAMVILERGVARVTYATSAEVTEGEIKANFGTLGEIDVHAVPTGGTVTESSDCASKPVTFEAGRWEGTIRFRGELGFSSVDASSAQAVVRPFLDLLCFDETSEGIGGHSPGALLTLDRRRGTEQLELTARKNRRVGPSRFVAALAELHAGVSIERSVKAEGGSSTFDFEIPPGRATLDPPKPFSGSLDFERTAGSKPRVTGNLEVDFPGRPNVAVLGVGKLHASLIRAVLNPSHPF